MGNVGKDAYDRILAEVLQAAESGQEPDLAEVAARYPGHETTVRDVLAAFGVYSRPGTEAAHPHFQEVLAPGVRLGDFEIIEPLAHGGMGEVYRARQVTLGGRVVAVKVLPGDTVSERSVARFEREARTLARLHHPNLAEVYGFGEERGTFFYAMRLVQGPTLREVLQHRAAARRTGHVDPVEQRRALVYRMVEIADALAVVHAAGAIHRDIKPANIVFEGGTPDQALSHAAVLVDFGLVRFTDTSTLTQTGDSSGTPSYAPPEQLLGREIDARADVFSLGVTLHDLLARREPHERAQASSGLERLRTIDSTFDPDLSAVVGKAADPEPRWRYPDASSLRDDLVAYLAGEGVTARRMPWTERTRRWAIRHPRRVTLVAAAIVVLVIAIGGIAGFGRVWGSVSSARQMLSRWDLPALSREVAEIPRWLPLGLVAEPDLAEAARRLRARDPADPFIRIHDALLDNKLEDALSVATTAIETQGFGSDSLVRDFLIHEFEARSTAPESRERPWALFAARLFYEKPVFDPSDIPRVEPFRRALLASWSRDDLELGEREYLLTAVSGCAQPEDLSPFLSWSLEANRTTEERRLVLRLIDQVVTRAWRCGRLDHLDLGTIWSVLVRTWDDWADRNADQQPWGAFEALSRACRKTLLADRALGRRTFSPTTLLPTDWERLLEDLTVRAPLAPWLECLATAGTPELVAALGAPSPPALVHALEASDPHRLGLLCSLLPTEHRDAAAARRRSCHPESWIDAFDLGWQHGDELLRGNEPEVLLDEDTLLQQADAIRVAPELLPETTWREWASRDPYSSIGGGLARVLREARSRIRDGPDSSTGSASSPDAIWRFHAGCAARSGTAAGKVFTEAGSLVQDGDAWYARLAAFGKSTLHLEFDVPADSLGIDRLASLGLQTNVRDLYPRLGTSRVAVELDGTEIGSISLGSPSTIEQSFQIPSRALESGRNVLTIRLLAASTTPLRIHWVAIWSLPH